MKIKSKKSVFIYLRPLNTGGIILFGCLFTIFFSFKIHAQTSVTPTGSGTQTDPYLISNIDNLYWVTQNNTEWDKYYLQTADIDASTTSSWPGHGYVPIGNTSTKFTGVYDGDGHTISGIYMDAGGYRGLFGYTDGAEVRNVGVINVDITASADRAGALVGYNDNSAITNCYSTGTISSSANYVGGLLGYHARSTLTDSYSEVTVSGDNRVGGLTGGITSANSPTGSLVENSYATGDVSGNYYVGGLSPHTFESSVIKSYATGNVNGINDNVGGLVASHTSGSYIEDSFATGNVTGDDVVGGLVGGNNGTISSSFSTGYVDGDLDVGGLVGEDLSGTVNNSYWNTETSEQGSSAGGSGLTTSQMIQQSNFSGFDFTNDWQIYEGYSFPFLKDVGDHLTTVLEMTGSENWRTMSSPLVDAPYSELLKELWIQGFTGADYDGGDPNLFTRSESAQTWNPPANASEIPAAGKGFLLYVYKDDQFGEAGNFPKTLVKTGRQRFGSVTLPVSLTKSGSGGSYVEADDGWNLVGNPYASPIDWDASGWSKNGLSGSIYVWSEQDDDYRTWNGSTGSLGSGVIAPWQGFWVKADNSGSPSLQMDEAARSSGGQFLKENEFPVIEFILNGNERHSSAYVMLHPEARLGIDPFDAWKLQPLSSDHLSFYSLLHDGHALDINTLPLPEIGESPLSIKLDIDGTTLNGSYELTWQTENLPPDVTFMLTDNETNEEIPLKRETIYTFEITGRQEKKNPDSSENQPAHSVFKPELIQAKTTAEEEEPRFTLTILSTENGTQSELPTTVVLKQNYPNPFNPSTVISYQLPETTDVELSVYDLTGREVSTLVDGQVQAGSHRVTFDGSKLSSGVYVYQLIAGSRKLSRKLTLIK